VEIVAFLVALVVLAVIGLAATGRMPFPSRPSDADGPRNDALSTDPRAIAPEDRTAEPPGSVDDAG
jgi:hypothetical protein